MRNVSPIKINEFQIASGAPANATNSFIELYNAGAAAVDISNWTLTEHATQQAIFSSGEDSGRDEARGRRLLRARSLQLRARGDGAQR